MEGGKAIPFQRYDKSYQETDSRRARRKKCRSGQSVIQRVCNPCEDVPEDNFYTSFCLDSRKYPTGSCRRAGEKLFRGRYSLTVSEKRRKMISKEDQSPNGLYTAAADMEKIKMNHRAVRVKQKDGTETEPQADGETRNKKRKEILSEKLRYQEAPPSMPQKKGTITNREKHGNDDAKNKESLYSEIQNSGSESKPPRNDGNNTITMDNWILKEPASKTETENSIKGAEGLSVLKEIFIRCPEDEEECDISDIVCLRSGNVVLADWQNQNIKLVTTTGKTRILKRFQSYPWNLAESRLEDNKIYVTLPALKKVAVLKIDEEVTIDGYISAAGECWGIACTTDRLITSIWDKNAKNGSVQIMKFDGTVLEVFQYDEKLGGLLNSSCYLTLNELETMLFVIDSKNGMISIIEIKQDKLITYDVIRQKTMFADLSGTALGLDGTIYAVDLSKKYVYKIEKDGKCYKSPVALDINCGLICPRSICFDAFDNLLYVAGNGKCIRVYNLN